MSADLLREAAAGIRAAVGGLTTDTQRWDDAFPAARVYADKSTYERIIVHPGVALAVADWLDSCLARDPRTLGTEAESALVVARAYLGRES